MATDIACEDAMHTSLPGSQPLSSNAGSPHGSGHDLDGMKSSMPYSQNLYTSKRRSRKSLLLQLGCPVWIHISRKHLVTLRPDSLRWNRMSAASLHVCAKSRHVLPRHQSVSGSARSWPALKQVDGSAAAGSHGPGSSDDNRNTRRRLDPSSITEDEQSRSAVLFRFSCEQYLKGITKWIDTL